MPKASPSKVAHFPATPRSTVKAASASTAVDESSWPRTTLRSRVTICKTVVKQLYRLHDADIAHLKYQLDSSVRKIDGRDVSLPMYLYKEREVERAAWRKHGGPDGFKTYLDKLKTRHSKMQQKKPLNERKAFAVPRCYTAYTGWVAGITHTSSGLVPRNRTLEEYWTRTGPLLQLRKELPSWIWWAGVRYMLEECIPDPYKVRDEPYWGPVWDREYMEGIVGGLKELGDYPDRPEQSLPSSPSVDNLRAILDRAPRPSEVYKQAVDGIETHEDFIGNYSASWALPYLDELDNALIDVVRAHGVGASGWETIRWEVYDKNAECFGGIRRDWCRLRGSHWVDEARDWLCWRMKVEDSSPYLPADATSSLLVTDAVSG